MTIEEIGTVIRERRKLLGITQPDLAEIAQVSINTLYKLERGEFNPSVKILNQLSEVLGLELNIGLKKTDR